MSSLQCQLPEITAWRSRFAIATASCQLKFDGSLTSCTIKTENMARNFMTLVQANGEPVIEFSFSATKWQAPIRSSAPRCWSWDNCIPREVDPEPSEQVQPPRTCWPLLRETTSKQTWRKPYTECFLKRRLLPSSEASAPFGGETCSDGGQDLWNANICGLKVCSDCITSSMPSACEKREKWNAREVTLKRENRCTYASWKLNLENTSQNSKYLEVYPSHFSRLHDDFSNSHSQRKIRHWDQVRRSLPTMQWYLHPSCKEIAHSRLTLQHGQNRPTYHLKWQESYITTYLRSFL